MEKLQSLLAEFNRHGSDGDENWHRQFSVTPFPAYWRIVYRLLSDLKSGNVGLRVREIGAGYGDISAVALHLGFTDVAACERCAEKALQARAKIKMLFGRDDVIWNCDYDRWGDRRLCDVLIMVNCVYVENAKTRQEYVTRLQEIVAEAGDPRYFIYEAVDVRYDGNDAAFPEPVRLSEPDLVAAFPHRAVVGWDTYRRPANRSDKRIYFLTREDP